METHNATITRTTGKTSLVLDCGQERLEIVLTDDKPNDVKNVFNNLIRHLKKGEFNFNLNDETKDLFYFICIEYIGQLNSELSTIYKDLEDYQLLDNDVTNPG